MQIKAQNSNIGQFKNSTSSKTIYWLGGLISMILIAYYL